jgi:YVTN family beta-propeller protein
MNGRDVQIGGELAGYRIESLIGRGGMGVVYLAEHLRLRRKAALKVLAPELASDERFRSRFLVEAELAASIDHPNIVTVFDAGEADGLLYIAMRLVEGTDLKAVIEREGPLGLDRTTSVITQVASALDAAHAKNLIHRDVKPANILITGGMGSDHAYLTDFGLTKRPDQTTGLTRTGQFMGSVGYAAPEQFEGKPLDARTDVYSLSCVAYECLTGEVPFQREQEAAVMYAHLRDAPPRPSASRPDLSPAVDGVISRGMAKRPDDRYPSAGSFAGALRGALPGGPSVAPPSRPKRRLALAGVSVALVAAVVIGVFVIGTRHTPRHEPPDGRPTTAASAAPPAFMGVIRLDPDTGKQVKLPISLAVSDVPNDKAILTGDGFVWLYDSQGNKLYKISPQTNTVINTLEVKNGARMAFGNGYLWIPEAFFFIGPSGGPMQQIDPTTFAVVRHVDLPGGCCVAIAYGEHALWALGSDEVVRIDPSRRQVTDVIPAGGLDLSVGGGKVWVLTPLGQVVPIDAKRRKVGRPVPVPGDNPVALAVGDAVLWLVDRGGTVARIPIGGQFGIEQAAVGDRPNAVTVGAGAVWVANYGDGTVSRIDPNTNEVQTIVVGGHPTQIAIDSEGSLWIVTEPASPAFGS